MGLKWKKGKTQNTAEVVERNAAANELPALVNNHHVYPHHRRGCPQTRGREAHDGHWLVFAMMTPTGTAPAGLPELRTWGDQGIKVSGQRALTLAEDGAPTRAGGKHRRPRTRSEPPSRPAAHLLSEELPP